MKEKQLLTEDEYRRAREQYGESFKAAMGAEAVKMLLERLNLVDLSRNLRDELALLGQKEKPSKQKMRDLVKRLKVVESLRDSGLGGPPNKPEWMVLECIPVIPPDLRPLVLLDSGNFATINSNNARSFQRSGLLLEPKVKELFAQVASSSDQLFRTQFP